MFLFYARMSRIEIEALIASNFYSIFICRMNTLLKSFQKGTTTTATMSRLRDIVETADLHAEEKVKAVQNELQEHQFHKWSFKWFRTDSQYWTCYSAHTKCSLGKCTLVKPIRTWIPNSRWQVLDTKCLYLVIPIKWEVNPRWFYVPYRKYNNKDKAFDSTMKALVKLVKKELGMR